MTDCLYAVAENIRNYIGGYGIDKRYADYFDTQPKEEKEAVDIIKEVIEKAGLGVIEDEPT